MPALSVIWKILYKGILISTRGSSFIKLYIKEQNKNCKSPVQRLWCKTPPLRWGRCRDIGWRRGRPASARRHVDVKNDTIDRSDRSTKPPSMKKILPAPGRLVHGPHVPPCAQLAARTCCGALRSGPVQAVLCAIIYWCYVFLSILFWSTREAVHFALRVLFAPSIEVRNILINFVETYLFFTFI